MEYLKSLKSHLNEQQEKDLKKGELKEKKHSSCFKILSTGVLMSTLP